MVKKTFTFVSREAIAIMMKLMCSTSRVCQYWESAIYVMIGFNHKCAHIEAMTYIEGQNDVHQSHDGYRKLKWRRTHIRDIKTKLLSPTKKLHICLKRHKKTEMTDIEATHIEDPLVVCVSAQDSALTKNLSYPTFHTIVRFRALLTYVCVTYFNVFLFSVSSPTNAHEKLTETSLRPWCKHMEEFLEPVNQFLTEETTCTPEIR